MINIACCWFLVFCFLWFEKTKKNFFRLIQKFFWMIKFWTTSPTDITLSAQWVPGPVSFGVDGVSPFSSKPIWLLSQFTKRMLLFHLHAFFDAVMQSLPFFVCFVWFVTKDFWVEDFFVLRKGQESGWSFWPFWWRSSEELSYIISDF